jgi:thymidylate synthase ThyX
MISAKVIADSMSLTGERLITVEATHHRFVLAELNTHRAFSRNSASSRAIPISKQLDKVLETPALPIELCYNQPGMQAKEPLTDADKAKVEEILLVLRDQSVDAVKALQSIGPKNPETGQPLGLHKQWANRYLEPFMWHTVIVSSTEWENFFNQRYSTLAQPEFFRLAAAMRDAIDASSSTLVNYGEWHLPYILPSEREDFSDDVLKMISVARCARVSYLTHDGQKDIKADIALYHRMVTAKPPHWSPLEHVATPFKPTFMQRLRGVKPLGNFDNWSQLRHSESL